MNIISECERVGIALQKCELGNHILDNFKMLQETLSSSAFDLFTQALRKNKWGTHFFSYHMVYDTLKLNTDNPLLKADIEQIINNNYILRHLTFCKQMGDFIEDTCRMLFQNKVQNSIQSSIKLTPKLVRAIQDLSVACQRIGLLQSLLQSSKTKVFLDIESELIKICGNDRSYPYSKKIRSTIKGMKKAGHNAKEINTIYNIIVVTEIIKQVIFDVFMGYILRIDNSCILNNTTRSVGQIRFFKLKLSENGMKIMDNNIYLIKFSTDQSNDEYGLVLQKNMRWGQAKEFNLSIRGLLYPNDDRIEL